MRIRILFIITVLLAASIPVHAQDDGCNIDLGATIETLFNAQRQADSGNPFGAVQNIDAAQAELAVLAESCADVLFPLPQAFTAPDESITFNYPEGWRIIEQDENAYFLGSSAQVQEAFNSGEFAVGEQGIAMFVIDFADANIEFETFDDLEQALREDFDFGGYDRVIGPIMLEGALRPTLRVRFEDDDASGIVDIIDYVNDKRQIAVMLIGAGRQDESAMLEAVVRAFEASIRFSHIDVLPKTWYFAGNREAGSLMAYTPSDDMHLLIESGVVDVFLSRAVRINPQTVLAHLTVDEQPGLFLLTPDAAQRLPVTDEVSSLLEDEPLFTTVSEPYAVLTLGHNPFDAEALLVDTERGTVEQLTGSILSFPPTNLSVRFSADKRFLRYMSQETPDDFVWQIRERDLATGEERILHAIEVPERQRFPNLAIDQFGEHWLLTKIDTETDTVQVLMLFNDSTLEILEEASLGQQHIWQMGDDYLAVSPLACETDCTLEVRPLDGEETITFPLPEAIMRPILVTRLDDGRLIVAQRSQYWLLDNDGTTESLGFVRPQELLNWRREIPGSRQIFANADRDATHYLVWDMQQGTLILERSLDGGVAVIYRDEGLIVQHIFDDDADSYEFYPEAEDTVIDIPQLRVFEILPDGRLLHLVTPFGNEDSVPGIYQFDLATGEDLLLLEGAEPVATLALP